MDALLATAEWLAIVLGGLIIRFALVVLLIGALVMLLLPVLYAFEGGRRLVRRIRGIEDVHGFEWRRQPRYAPAHLWLGERGSIVRVGIDSMAARLLGRAEAVDLLPSGARVRAGEAMASFITSERVVTLHAPIDGIVERTNPRLEDRPDLATRHPYDDGWLVDVRPAGRDLQALPRAIEARRWFSDEAVRLTFALEHATGYAAADGGEPMAPHHELLDDAELGTLAQEFLHAKVTLRA